MQQPSSPENLFNRTTSFSPATLSTLHKEEEEEVRKILQLSIEEFTEEYWYWPTCSKDSPQWITFSVCPLFAPIPSSGCSTRLSRFLRSFPRGIRAIGTLPQVTSSPFHLTLLFDYKLLRWSLDYPLVFSNLCATGIEVGRGERVAERKRDKGPPSGWNRK